MKTSLPVVEASSSELPRRIAVALHKVALAARHQAWAQASAEGLSPTQGELLAALVTHGPMRVGDLARRVGLGLPTVSDSVRVLVEKGLAVKSRDPDHARATRVTPTMRGRAAGGRARAWPEALTGAVGTLTPEAQRALFGGLVRTLHALEQQQLVPGAGMCVDCAHFRPRVHRGPRPHHCAFVDAPRADDELALDCGDHAPASPEAHALAWAAFVTP